MKGTLPIRPPAPWRGGKRLLAQRLVARIQAMPHRAYVEPFLGMGGVFFRRAERARDEVINDRNGELINLFRILQRHYVPFLEMLRFSRSNSRRLVSW